MGRRFDSGFVELLGAEAPPYLLLKTAATEPFEGAVQLRSYARHWTPLHLDFVVTDLDAAIARALTAGPPLSLRRVSTITAASPCCTIRLVTAFASFNSKVRAMTHCRRLDSGLL